MSNKIILDAESIDALEEWAKYNPGLVIAAQPFFDKFEVYLHYMDNDLLCYVTKYKSGIKIATKVNKKLIADLYLEKTDNHDFDVACKPKCKDYSSDAFPSLAYAVTNMVTMANAFLTYGNLEENRVLVAHGKNDGEDKIIAFRTFENKVYAVSSGSHRSPEGVFNVRGHFRRYKDGKVVWIDSYFKGLNKNNE